MKIYYVIKLDGDVVARGKADTTTRLKLGRYELHFEKVSGNEM